MNSHKDLDLAYNIRTLDLRPFKICLLLKGLFNLVSGELIVSSPDEITRERLEREATLLHSVERETECEAVTEREDIYEVIIDSDGELKTERYTIGE